MSTSELRMMLADVATLSPEQLRARRASLRLTETDVADTLLLSVAQVRGIERGELQPFYNEGFYLRARAKYITLLTTYSTPARPPASAAMPDGAEAPRLTFGDEHNE
jgi:transcriptional regulator with XRE-family HTH domain